MATHDDARVSLPTIAKFSRRITERLGIDRAIFGAPMGGVAGPELVAAVSNAGGFGLLGHANLPPDTVRAEILRTKALTSRPFGIGLLFPSGAPSARVSETPDIPEFLRGLGVPDPAFSVVEDRTYDHALAEERLEIAIAEGVSALSCGLGVPTHIVERAHAAGMTVISLVGSRKAAISAADRGADLIVAQGHEAGGHTGRTSTLVLVPQVIDSVNIPVIAAGGIVDGRTMAAALMLGAEGVLIGTRFLATPEALTAQNHKDAVVAMVDDRTIVSRSYTGKPSRVIRNSYTDAWAGHEAEILPMPTQWEMVAPLVQPAKAQGSMEIGNWPTGQGAVLVKSSMSAGAVVEEIAREAELRLSGSGRPA